MFGRDIREFVANEFQQEHSLAALFRAQASVVGEPEVLDKLRECMALGRELTNLERLVGHRPRSVGGRLVPVASAEVSRGKLRELVAMVGLGVDDLDQLLDDAGLDGEDDLTP